MGASIFLPLTKKCIHYISYVIYESKKKYYLLNKLRKLIKIKKPFFFFNAFN